MFFCEVETCRKHCKNFTFKYAINTVETIKEGKLFKVQRRKLVFVAVSVYLHEVP